MSWSTLNRFVQKKNGGKKWSGRTETPDYRNITPIERPSDQVCARKMPRSTTKDCRVHTKYQFMYAPMLRCSAREGVATAMSLSSSVQLGGRSALTAFSVRCVRSACNRIYTPYKLSTIHPNDRHFTDICRETWKPRTFDKCAKPNGRIAQSGVDEHRVPKFID